MIKQPNIYSASLSIIIIFLFLATFGLLAYLPSALNDDVNKNIFTISQSLAFSIKPAFVCVFTLAMLLLAYLIVYRGHKYLWIRLFLLLVIYSFIITILWITTYYSKEDHYILAGFIFSLSVVFIIINNYLIYNGIKFHSNYTKFFLIGTSILSIVSILGLIISISLFNNISEIFPSFENLMLLVEGLSVFALGFM
jgi:hypothetical protein